MKRKISFVLASLMLVCSFGLFGCADNSSFVGVYAVNGEIRRIILIDEDKTFTLYYGTSSRLNISILFTGSWERKSKTQYIFQDDRDSSYFGVVLLEDVFYFVTDNFESKKEVASLLSDKQKRIENNTNWFRDNLECSWEALEKVDMTFEEYVEKNYLVL